MREPAAQRSENGPTAGPPTVTARLRGPIRRRKLYEDVAERIEEMIRDGNYQPGDPLPSEREFMKAFGVGRSAVREAILSLQRMGLVVVNSGERSRVATPTPKAMVAALSGLARILLAEPDGMRHFQDARALFEGGVAERAATRARPDDLERLRGILERNRGRIGDHAAFMRSDIDFHFAIAEAAGNPIFAALHEGVVEWLLNQRAISGKAPDAGKDAYCAHVRIFEAIAARDGPGARAAMERHLQMVAKLYWKIPAAGDGD
jgi:DNA-binding FadR family transcriptional regulator